MGTSGSPCAEVSFGTAGSGLLRSSSGAGRERQSGPVRHREAPAALGALPGQQRPRSLWGCRHLLRVPPRERGSPAGLTVPVHPRGSSPDSAGGCWGCRWAEVPPPRPNLSLLLIVAAREPPLRRRTAQRCSPQPWGHPGRGCPNPCCRSTEKFEGRLMKSCEIAPLPAPGPGRCPAGSSAAGERGARGALRAGGDVRGALCPWLTPPLPQSKAPAS